MARSVAVVDYGMGNLRSVSQAALRATAGDAGDFAEVPVGEIWRAISHAAAGSGFDVVVTSRAEEIMAAERVILPGQGAIRDCMRELRGSGLQDAVLHAAAHKPLLGVCVGMQMLLDRSEEQDTPGLALIAGQVKRFRLDGRRQPDGSRYKVPQMGWNRVAQAQPHPLWDQVPDGTWFYFVHSFYALPSDPRHSAGETDYGGRFTSAVARDNIFATQFHPEKSAEHGLQLYRNFLHWNP